MCLDWLHRYWENATYLWQEYGKGAAKETCSLQQIDKRSMSIAKFLPE